MRRLGVTLLLLLGLVGRSSAAQESLRVSVLTFGPGDLVFERFGHNALRIVDPATGSDLAYNWGMFDFNQPNFLGRFLSGDTKYWVAAFNSLPLIAFYASHDRERVASPGHTPGGVSCLGTPPGVSLLRQPDRSRL